MLNQPTRVTRAVNDISLQNFWADRLFSIPGGVSGGTVLYDVLTSNDLYPTRDVQNVEPGGEFPILTMDRPTPQVAQVEKFGGKFFVTDEARDRNDADAGAQRCPEDRERGQQGRPHPCRQRDRRGGVHLQPDARGCEHLDDGHHDGRSPH
jgi:hypothetical protein